MTIAKTVARQRAMVEDGAEKIIEPSSELIALGAATRNSFFHGYPVTGSFSRTAVNADSGARSQWAAFIASLTVGTSLLTLTDQLRLIPKVSLAAIVLVAVIKLIHQKGLLPLASERRDFLYLP